MTTPPPSEPSLPGFLADRAARARAASSKAATDARNARNGRNAQNQPAAPQKTTPQAALDPHKADGRTQTSPDHDTIQQPLQQPGANKRRKTAKHAALAEPRPAASVVVQGNPPTENAAVTAPPGMPQWRFLGKLHPVGEQASGLDEELLMRVVRENAAGDPRLLEIAAPHLPRVFSAMIAGAQMVGSVGDRDRSRLFRILGLPWADKPLAGDRGGAGDGMAAMAERLARAHSRVEGRGRVTATMSVTVEGAENGDDRTVAHLFAGQARDPTDPSDAS